MGWPYGVPSLTHEEKLLRRQTIDLYACIAHYSALAPALLFLLYRLARRVPGVGRSASTAAYEQVPSSPVAKARRLASSSSLAQQWQKLVWWLRDDVFFRDAHWGQRDQWLLGLAAGSVRPRHGHRFVVLRLTYPMNLFHPLLIHPAAD